MRKYVLPALILCLFILESISVDFFGLLTINQDWVIVPRYMLIVITLCAIYTSPYVGLICAMLFGFLYDIVYTEILGVYLFAFGISVYIVSGILRFVNTNYIISFIMILLSITITEHIVFGIHSLIGSTIMTHSDFVSVRLLPTLGFNAIIAIVLLFPIKLFMERLAIDQKDEL
ncbi:rod shape-determining protein MreD [Sutcliffiella rhizosphaerae]|uniref:Rod shape-determining protein MreD n=1 Tax=Sutcliffiella rhizosphaerae TaxID=2880967 RepID=A0ABM8YHY2_9BACI|nr:rod shape-determining protein MreD [Sutcliffiella rhizosphaerae]CAG9619498.1 Rod shape-determining protein MreD [Sutcliffiella rhizosphaerae]